MGKYDEAIQAQQPDAWWKCDEAPRQMRSRADIFESVNYPESPTHEDQQLAMTYATLEVLLDIRDLLSGHKMT